MASLPDDNETANSSSEEKAEPADQKSSSGGSSSQKPSSDSTFMKMFDEMLEKLEKEEGALSNENLVELVNFGELPEEAQLNLVNDQNFISREDKDDSADALEAKSEETTVEAKSEAESIQAKLDNEPEATSDKASNSANTDDEASAKPEVSVVTAIAEETAVAAAKPEDAPIAAMSEDAPVTTMATNAPVATTSEDAPVASTSEDTPVASNSEEAPVTAAAEDAPVTATAEDAPVATKSEDAPVAAESEDTPAAAQPEDAPIVAKPGDTLVAAAADDAPIVAKPGDTLVAAAAEDALVETLIDAKPDGNDETFSVDPKQADSTPQYGILIGVDSLDAKPTEASNVQGEELATMSAVSIESSNWPTDETPADETSKRRAPLDWPIVSLDGTTSKSEYTGVDNSESGTERSSKTQLSDSEITKLNSLGKKSDADRTVLDKPPELRNFVRQKSTAYALESGLGEYQRARRTLYIGALVVVVFGFIAMPMLMKRHDDSLNAQRGTIAQSEAAAKEQKASSDTTTNSTRIANSSVAGSSGSSSGAGSSSGSSSGSGSGSSGSNSGSGSNSSSGSSSGSQSHGSAGGGYNPGNPNPTGSNNPYLHSKDPRIARADVEGKLRLAERSGIDITSFRRTLKQIETNPRLEGNELAIRLEGLSAQISAALLQQQTRPVLTQAASIATLSNGGIKPNEPSYGAQKSCLMIAIKEAKKQGIDTAKYSSAIRNVEQDINYKEHHKELATKMQGLMNELVQKMNDNERRRTKEQMEERARPQPVLLQQPPLQQPPQQPPLQQPPQQQQFQ